MDVELVLAQFYWRIGLSTYFYCDYGELNQNTGFDCLKIIESFGFGFLKPAGSKAEGNISYNYRFHIVTLFRS